MLDSRVLPVALLGAALVLSGRPAAAAAPAPACAAGQLAASDAGTKVTGNRAVTTIQLTNNSATSCTVAGYPQVRFVRLSGADAPVVVNQTSHDAHYTTPAPSTITLHSLRRATFLLGYPLADAHKNACAAISTIVIGGFAKQGTVSLPDTIAPCTTLNLSPYFTR
jgi:hypothetical protein